MSIILRKKIFESIQCRTMEEFFPLKSQVEPDFHGQLSSVTGLHSYEIFLVSDVFSVILILFKILHPHGLKIVSDYSNKIR